MFITCQHISLQNEIVRLLESKPNTRLPPEELMTPDESIDDNMDDWVGTVSTQRRRRHT